MLFVSSMGEVESSSVHSCYYELSDLFFAFNSGSHGANYLSLSHTLILDEGTLSWTVAEGTLTKKVSKEDPSRSSPEGPWSSHQAI